MTKLTSWIGTCFVYFDLYEIYEFLPMDIKVLYAFQPDVRAYVRNLIYNVRLEVNVKNRPAETFFECVVTLF